MSKPVFIQEGNVCRDDSGRVFVVENVKHKCSSAGCNRPAIYMGRTLDTDEMVTEMDVTFLADDLESYDGA